MKFVIFASIAIFVSNIVYHSSINQSGHMTAKEKACQQMKVWHPDCNVE
jgi:hypothetical protein